MKARRLGLWLAMGAVVLASAVSASAQQKVGWIDSQEIMKKFPAALEAQTKLDGLVAQWQGEINKLQSQFQQEASDYQKRRLILPEQARVQEEQKLADMQKQIVDLRNRRFGEHGDLYQQQNAIMRPVQEQVLNAIDAVAKKDGYDYIFDKSGQILLMFASDKYDVTQQVLDELKIPTNALPGTQTSPTMNPTQPRPMPPTTTPTTPPPGQPTQQPSIH